MLLIVGLGNPGEKYKRTRHNVGFMVLDRFAKENRFSGFVFSKKLISEVTEGTIDAKKIILVKPQTFMNKSGLAVRKLTSKYKLSAKNIILVHDDIDLPLGKIKTVFSRGSAGHKGVESIIKALKTKDFVRIRIGIQPLEGKPRNIDSFVVKNFTLKEIPLLNQALAQATQQITAIAKT